MLYSYFLEVSGDSDYAAMIFNDNFNAEAIAVEMLMTGESKRTVFLPDEYGEGQTEIWLTLHKIPGEVPAEFLELASNVWGDYDLMKDHDIFQVFPVRSADCARRPIYAEDLKELFAEDGHLSAYIEEFIDNCPSAALNEKPPAEWIPLKDNGFYGYKCSACNRRIKKRLADSSAFCPKCGAPMKGKRND